MPGRLEGLRQGERENQTRGDGEEMEEEWGSAELVRGTAVVPSASYMGSVAEAAN